MKHITITFFLIILLSMAGFGVSAHDIEVKNADGVTIYYKITSEAGLAVSYRGNYYDSHYNEYTGTVNIPSTVKYNGTTYIVKSIGDYAFYGCSSLTSIEIPNSVKSIDYCAFSDCSDLTSIEIPNSVTSVGDFAFSGCSGLTSIEIPNSVTNIGYSVFSRCSGLTSVTIPNCVTTIGDYAFYGCSSLTSVTIPNCVTTIGDYAFQNCIGLTSIEIPNSVTSIGRGAFLYCSGLTSVTIPNSVTSIGNFAFSGCSLTELVCYAETPPFCDYIILEGVNISLCTLKVPKGSKDAYRQADGWKDFVNIEEVEVTGIEAVTAEGVSNADITDIYDLNGRRRDALQPGVNIVKMSDGTTRKVIKR